MQETMKKKVDTTEEEAEDPFKAYNRKRQSEFMKQLSDLAQQPVTPTPQPVVEPIDEEPIRQAVRYRSRYFLLTFVSF